MSSGGGISLPSHFDQIRVEQKEKGGANGVKGKVKRRQTEQRALDRKSSGVMSQSVPSLLWVSPCNPRGFKLTFVILFCSYLHFIDQTESCGGGQTYIR